MSASPSFLQVDDLEHTFRQGGTRQQVLKKANFTLQRGEIVALLGRSGSGKSTLLNLLSGIDQPESGSVTMDGTRVTTLDEPDSTLFRRRHIGFVYQFFNLIPGLTATENVALVPELNGSSTRQALAATQKLFASLGLQQVADKFPAQLSGGEQQRVAIARALIHQPALVLADEPTGNLDARTGQQVLDWLHAQLRNTGSTCLLVTHSLAVARTADRILTLDDGAITERQGEFAW